ncbi:MAG: glycoside hydrolase family 43 protein [Anaerolineales bacterium]|nr:glycoside hydrolase family 43 protein [Anaerolineales bacterium]
MKIPNPIIPGFYPDPSICRVGHDYFLVASSFEYFPGVPLFHSRDLIYWRQIGHCLTRPSQLPLVTFTPSGGIFAPTIRYHNGVFYMVTTNVTDGGNFYVHTRDPFGEWSEPIWVDQSGIDPSLYFDDDGRVYLTSTFIHEPLPEEIDPANPSWGIQQSEIDIATGLHLSRPRPIWFGTGGKYPEAPHLYKIGDTYYLMIAEGGTEYNHRVTLARSASPWGPWEPCPHNPILSQGGLHSPFQGLGHADLVKAHDGSWWLVCLGFRPYSYPPYYHLGRETFLAPVTWDDQGWPHVGDHGRIRLAMAGPHLPTVVWERPPIRDDFDQPELSLPWNFLGHPWADDGSLTDRPGALRLLGNASRLDDGAPVIFIGRRQQHLDAQVAALLDFEPDADGEEAGLTVWMNPRHHYDLLVMQQAGQRRVAVRQRIGPLTAVVASEDIAPGPVTLTIRAEREKYTFGFSLDSAEPHTLATGDTRYISTEVAGGFTGVYLAMYATGNGQASRTPAFFEWFDYGEVDEQSTT